MDMILVTSLGTSEMQSWAQSKLDFASCPLDRTNIQLFSATLLDYLKYWIHLPRGEKYS
jgi:hypothetical protein